MSAQPAGAARTAVRPVLTSTDISLLGVVLVWGIGYVGFKVAQNEVPTLLFNVLRYSIATPLLWLVLLRSDEDWRLPRKDWLRTAAIGLIGVLVYGVVFAAAAKMTTAANTSLLLALSPIWTVLLLWMGGKGAPTVRYLLGSLVAFGGAAIVIGFGATALAFDLAKWQGDLLALVASVIFAWYGLAAQPLLKSHSGVKVQAWINLIALAGFLAWQAPAAAAFDWAAVSLKAWLWIAWVGLLVSMYAHMVWYSAIATVGPNRVMLALYLVPAVAAASGALFLGQGFSWIQILGAALALGGVALVRRGQQ
ncbi:MAG TPA: DMT family transporter [Symbiobacteriaceae bacterium]|nr:DMT family transporter [Symbiobacteriaceae bacterium]